MADEETKVLELCHLDVSSTVWIDEFSAHLINKLLQLCYIQYPVCYPFCSPWQIVLVGASQPQLAALRDLITPKATRLIAWNSDVTPRHDWCQTTPARNCVLNRSWWWAITRTITGVWMGGRGVTTQMWSTLRGPRSRRTDVPAVWASQEIYLYVVARSWWNPKFSCSSAWRKGCRCIRRSTGSRRARFGITAASLTSSQPFINLSWFFSVFSFRPSLHLLTLPCAHDTVGVEAVLPSYPLYEMWDALWLIFTWSAIKTFLLLFCAAKKSDSYHHLLGKLVILQEVPGFVSQTEWRVCVELKLWVHSAR